MKKLKQNGHHGIVCLVGISVVIKVTICPQDIEEAVKSKS